MKTGIGWRSPHHRELLERRPAVGFLEIHAENHMGGGNRAAVLDAARKNYPISVHGVGLSLGSVEPVDPHHLGPFAELVDRVDPVLVSEHVSWCRQDGVYLNDLLPLPYTEEALDVLVRNIGQVQDRLKRPILMENPSTYLELDYSCIPDGEFLAEMTRRSGCGLLLDVNNLYVNQRNHGQSASQIIATLDMGKVGEIHLAGYREVDLGDAILLIDNHGSKVADPVWDLFNQAAARFPKAAVLVEWDSDVPSLDVLVSEATIADSLREQTFEGAYRASSG